MFDCIILHEDDVTFCHAGDLFFNIVWLDDEFEETGLGLWAMKGDDGKFYDHGTYRVF